MATPAAMTAAFSLTFKDQFSPALRRCMELVQRFQELAKKLGFKELDGADASVQRLGKDIGVVNSQLGATARQAEAAASSIRRMSSAEITRARTMGAQAQQLNSLRSGGLSQIYGPGGIPLMSGGPRFVPNEEGASSRMGWRGRMGNALAATRGRFGQANAQIGLAGGAMAGISLEAPIHAAAELDQVLRQTAIMQNKSGRAAQQEVERLQRILGAESIETGQPLVRLAEAYKDLVNRGLGTDVVDKLIPIHGRAASAYGVDSQSMGQAVYALNKSLGISHEEMGGALAAMAQATHEGAFDMTSMSRYLPQISGVMNQLGMKGRGSADKAFAALEIVSRNAADPAQAAADFSDMMSHITQPFTKNRFGKAGIDIQAVMKNAAKRGIDPMEAYISTLERMIKGITDPVQQAFKLGVVLHNKQDATAALSLLQHKDDYKKLRDELDKIGADKLDRDWKTAMEGLMPQLMKQSAAAKALEQRIGLGFFWTVPVATALLGGVVVGLNWMADHLPVVLNGALGLTGGMLGLTAVLGVLGTVAGPVKAGWILLSGAVRSVGQALLWTGRAAMANPLVGATVLIGAAAVDIWRHWDRFRENWSWMWSGMRYAAAGFGQFISGLFFDDNERAAHGLHMIWTGVQFAWKAAWGKGGFMETLFGDFAKFIDNWSGGFATWVGTGIQTAMAGGANAIRESLEGWKKLFQDFKPEIPSITGGPPMAPPPGMTPDNWPKFKAPELRNPTSYQLQSPGAPPVERASYEHVIRIQTDNGLKATARSGDPSVRFTGATVDRGSMLTRT